MATESTENTETQPRPRSIVFPSPLHSWTTVRYGWGGENLNQGEAGVRGFRGFRGYLTIDTRVTD